uniref:ATP synthase subunit a n=1 Tax=Owenia fusiformis TaxID=6347 RepID=A0A0S2N0E3_OWEFU|nr:ATP synthase F0 subunit 6 [Owenia fusiformis]ALO81690.1 ATP synthase F0 subunit 6 [Owenia fusiformis]
MPLMLFHSEVGRSIGRQLGGFVNLVVSLFLMLMVVNLMGMIPYVFGVSAHICFSFIFGLPLWFSLILSTFSWNWYASVSHFLPSGAPIALIPFLVVIELVSTLVRPITLSARLAANLSAGHIVLGLMSVYLCKMIFSFSSVFFFLLLLEVGYFLFEVGVCMIQGYIFSLLITLYADEHSL